MENLNREMIAVQPRAGASAARGVAQGYGLTTMLTPEDIDRLQSFDGGDARVLSAYLDLDAARRIKRSYLIAFEDLIKGARGELAEPARDDLAREAAHVRAWLEGQEPRGKGLALI